MAISLVTAPAGPTVTFWGAARAVTGSLHLVEAAGCKLLLDCGLVLGHHPDARQHNRLFPVVPDEIDAVVLSHAHVDHCGNLPHLVRQGFRGPIYCTPATRDLLAVMLADSARFQERDDFVQHVLEQPPQALYTHPDVAETVARCVAVPYDRRHEIRPGVELRLADAGHILGSATVALTFTGGGRGWRLAFTGDLGRRGLPLVRDPAPLPAADLLLCESTYGGRTHPPWPDTVAALAEVVRRTAERGGKVLIPSFSLGRTQVVVHVLRAEMAAGRLPPVPLFVDSRLSADISEVYAAHDGCLREPPAGAADWPEVRYVRSLEESRELSAHRGPCVLVASGGMCEGGRSLHHLKDVIDDPRCSVVLVSYQAPHSLGRRLLERGPTVRFHGRKWNKWADVVELPGFSGHADHGDFLALLRPLAGRVARVRLVHGEEEQAEALAGALRAAGFADVAVPARGDVADVPGE
jgi:metallo-beta-lactamase family protein